MNLVEHLDFDPQQLKSDFVFWLPGFSVFDKGMQFEKATAIKLLFFGRGSTKVPPVCWSREVTE